MARANVALYAMNRGLISPLAMARTELERTALSAGTMINWMARTLGSMMLRPGLGYIGGIASNNLASVHPFIFASDDTAVLEFTDELLRIWVSDSLVTRPDVDTSITNGAFTSNVNNWSDEDDSGATSAWLTGGYLSLIGTGDGGAAARREQEVTVSGGDQDTLHALRIIIERGPVTLRVGSSSGDDDYINEVSLGAGAHSLAFTPSGNFFIEFSSYTQYAVLVDSVAVESSGTLTLPTPFDEADLNLIRIDQSADVVYVACEGYQQQKIERRDNNSWSVVNYEPVDGPFRNINITPVTLSADDTTGDVTLTASANLFSSGHVGGLFRLTSDGQLRTVSVTAQNTFSDPIQVVGVGGQRAFSVILENTWDATVTLQYSVSAPGSWVDFDTYTGNQSISVNDGLDNQIIYYRIGVKTGEFSSGQVDATLSHSSGAQSGIIRITAVNDATEAEGSVLSELGSTDATDNWYEGIWSDKRGWPTTLKLFQGRLWWFGKGREIGSVSDSFESFDDEVEGDAGPINRSIGFGPVDVINWAIPLQELFIGTAGSEIAGRSSMDAEILTPTNFNLVEAGTQGSAKVNAVKVDKTILFTQASKTRVYELFSSTETDEGPHDITIHIPEIGEPEITKMAVQRKPDTRVHCRRSDGKVAILIFDKAEDVICWLEVETDGDIEDIIILPGTKEDAVYYVVKRTINSSTVRYLEKWALEEDARGPTYIYSGASATVLTDLPYPNGRDVTVYDEAGDKVENLTVQNKSITLSSAATYARIVPSVHLIADSFIEYDGGSTDTITGLSHLEGETVVVRGDGKDLGTYTVASGSITLSQAVERAVIGLAYTAKWKSTKLAYAANFGSALNQRKAISQLGLVMLDTYRAGIQYGPDFNNLDNLPGVAQGAVVDEDHIFESYEEDMMAFLKRHTVDARLCLQAAAPNPCTVLATVIGIETNG